MAWEGRYSEALLLLLLLLLLGCCCSEHTRCQREHLQQERRAQGAWACMVAEGTREHWQAAGRVGLRRLQPHQLHIHARLPAFLHLI